MSELNKKLNGENIVLTLINAFKKEENLKYALLSNFIKSIKKDFKEEMEFKSEFLKKFFEELIKVRNEVKKEMEELPPQFNILDSIRSKTSGNKLQNFETYNSDLLTKLLKTKFTADNNVKINFVKLFLEFINKKFKNEIDLSKIKNYEKVTIKKEYYTDTGRRIDIFIEYNNNNEKFAIIIENKIDAIEQESQLKDYYDYITKNYGDKVYIIYLTRYGDAPKSLPKEYYEKEELSDKIACIKHGEIGDWLETILKDKEKYGFLDKEEDNKKNNYRLLKSALIQIIDNEKSLSGENTEDDMTEEKIKKLLNDSIFKEIKDGEHMSYSEVQEYIEMFKKIPDLLYRLYIEEYIKPHLDFSKKVYKYLEASNRSNDFKPLFCGKDNINDYINNEGWVHLIECGKNDVYLLVETGFLNNEISYYFGIYTDTNNQERKDKIITLESNIKENVFNKFYKENENWILRYKINYIEDKPEEIGEVMIKLYELLKKEGIM